MTGKAGRPTVWELPLRIWHWAFAMAIAGGLWTGLSGEIALIEWHMRCGYAVLGLLAFRMGWLLWGGLHARWSSFPLTPARIRAFLRRQPVPGARTVPGALLVLLLLLAALLQAMAGLFTSDFIFTDGPLVKYASGATVKTFTALHHRVFWVVLGLIGVHLTAHVVYALRRDPTPLGMFTGRKPASVPSTPAFWGRALGTALTITALAAWLLLG